VCRGCEQHEKECGTCCAARRCAKPRGKVHDDRPCMPWGPRTAVDRRNDGRSRSLGGNGKDALRNRAQRNPALHSPRTPAIDARRSRAGRSPGSPVLIARLPDRLAQSVAFRAIRTGLPLRGQPRLRPASRPAPHAFPFHPLDWKARPSGGHLRLKFYLRLL
jgi:hypothetical protein